MYCIVQYKNTTCSHATRPIHAGCLPHPVLRLGNTLATLPSNLPPVHATHARRLEEQRRPMALLDHMRQITPVRRIAVVLQILSASRIRQPKRVLLPLNNQRLGSGFRALLPFRRHLDPALQRVDRVHGVAHDLADGEGRVEARGDGAAQLLDGRDGFGAGARDDDVDRGLQLFFAAREEFDAVFDAVHAVGLVELAHCDGLCGVQAAGVDPFLDAVQVDRGHFDGEAVVFCGQQICAIFPQRLPFLSLVQLGEHDDDLLVHLSSLARNHNLRRLTTIEAERHLSMRLLTLVTSSGRLALA
jgi:hypothetical protein